MSSHFNEDTIYQLPPTLCLPQPHSRAVPFFGMNSTMAASSTDRRAGQAARHGLWPDRQRSYVVLNGEHPQKWGRV
jgi:hypothetical protein